MEEDRTVKKRCPVCGEPIEREIFFPLLDGTGRKVPRTVSVMCRCQTQKKEERDRRLKYEAEQRKIDELQKLSLMDERLRDASLDQIRENHEDSKAFSIALNYIRNFREMCEEGQGLLFYGDVGTGKSYTAAAMANELIRQKQPVIMTSFVKLLKESKDSALTDQLNRAKLLIIDDFGAERSTDYSIERVYDIIDSRYRSKKPLILTTNLTFDEMKRCDDIRYKRIYDRIFEMCYPVQFVGLSWRKKMAAEKFAKTKRLLEGK